MVYRIIGRKVWKDASLEQRSKWLEDLAFNCGCSGEVVIKCQSFKDYQLRKFQLWCLSYSESFVVRVIKRAARPIAGLLVRYFGYTSVD